MPQMTLKAARVNAGYTQMQVSEILNVSLASIKNWESGRTAPNLIVYKQLCELYGVGLDQIKVNK